MKAYLATTGALFALLAAVHVWQIIADWPGLLKNPWALLEAAIGLVSGGLAVWAWRLLRESNRGSTSGRVQG